MTYYTICSIYKHSICNAYMYIDIYCNACICMLPHLDLQIRALLGEGRLQYDKVVALFFTHIVMTVQVTYNKSNHKDMMRPLTLTLSTSSPITSPTAANTETMTKTRRAMNIITKYKLVLIMLLMPIPLRILIASTS